MPDDENALPIKVARVLNDNKQIPNAQKLANAKLIAAAPEMYSLLYDAMQELKHDRPTENGISSIWPDIQELLDKINGKEK